MGEPISLYRFLDSDAALKTLVAGRFRVGLASKFNDLFEWRLGFDGMASPEERKFAENFSNEHLPWSESWRGILCFSDIISDPVLWSYLADKHRGVAFEIKYPWKDDELVRMTYSNERPVLDFNQLREIRDEKAKDKYLLSLLDRLMRQKSMGFSFEREYRLHINLNNQTYCQVSDGWHHWQIPRDTLKKVVLGYCCALDDAIVRKLLDMNGFVDTKVERAGMCEKTYSII